MKDISIQSLSNKRLNLLINDIKFNRKAILNDKSKSEHLHKFRISIRKTRVYLTYLSKYFQSSNLSKCKKEFKYLGKLTNEPRDLDVYIEKFDSYINLLPKNEQNNLTGLISYLKNKRDKEYEKLIKLLDSKIYKNIIKNINIQIKNNNLFIQKRYNAKKVASKNLSKLYDNIINKGTIINQNSLNSRFHELRIDCKTLRYLIELFLPFYNKINSIKIID
ncbi:MAG: CHAD domain-containing protein [Campylobacterota bacterium]|nr:CHAD domain-containing protein [Campylobacterota bacterium]